MLCLSNVYELLVPGRICAGVMGGGGGVGGEEVNSTLYNVCLLTNTSVHTCIYSRSIITAARHSKNWRLL